MLEPDVVFREFASEIGKVTPWPQAMTGRTSAVMAALHKVAQSTPTGARKIYYRNCPEPNSYEFMLDFCCMDANSNEMLLAAESEWGEGDGQVEDDFQKLVYIKAGIKMMIYGNNRPSEIDRPSEIERIRKFLNSYPRNEPGDTYVLAYVNWEGTVKGLKLTINQDRVVGEPVPII